MQTQLTLKFHFVKATLFEDILFLNGSFLELWQIYCCLVCLRIIEVYKLIYASRFKAKIADNIDIGLLGLI